MIYIVILVLLLTNALLVYRIHNYSKTTSVKLDGNKENNTNNSAKQIDKFIVLFLQFINDITKYSEYLSLNMKNISEKSTILTTNSQLHILDLQNTQTQIEGMHNLLKSNSKISEGIKDTFKTVNENVAERQQHIVDAINEYKVIRENINLSKESIDKLVNYTNEVGGTINTINDISREINMLALNASIEAARAGEYGKGFSVVAKQVKKLSSETNEATNNISKMLKTITDRALVTQEDIGKTINILNSQSTMLKETVNSIGHITQMVGNTLNSIEELSDKNVQSYGTCTSVNSSSSIVVQSIENDMITIKEIDTSLKSQDCCIEDLANSTSSLKNLSENLFNLLEFDNNTIIAITEEYPPFVIENEDINNQGIDVDIVRQICARNNINFKLFFAPFDLSLELVKNGVVHMIPTISYTDQRNKFINFTNSYRDENKFILITNKQSNNTFHCYNDMKGCKVGIISMYTYPCNFLKDKNIIKDENYKLDTLFHKLLKNQIDAILLNNYIGDYYIRTNKLQTEVNISQYILSTNENFDVRLGLSKSKNTEELAELFNRELGNLNKEGIVKKIESKYLDTYL